MEQGNEFLKVIIGASSQDYPGWIRTQQHQLDLTRRADWAVMFPERNVGIILVEHVWEHLVLDETHRAAQICFEFLARGGFVRCAVPDGLFPSQDYQRLVQVGGSGSTNHPAATHKVVYTYQTLPPVFETEGFSVRLLEWWDEHSQFHAEPWDAQSGLVYRSARFDHRNQSGELGFTSLIIDACKP